MSEREAKLIDKGRLDAELISACIHCGLCLPACPTYLATGRETESPRGRIYLLGMWNKGELELEDGVSEHLDSCLGCLGCQTACPSGVRYEEILNQARPHLRQARARWLTNVLRFVFKHLLTNYGLLKVLGTLLMIWQRLGGRRLMSILGGLGSLDEMACDPGLSKGRRFGLLRRLAIMDAFLPDVPQQVPLPERSFRPGWDRGDLQLFAGCVMDVFYNDVNHAASETLEMQGYRVEVPMQTCCGALAFHAGEMDIAKELAKKNIDLFETTTGPVAVTSAGCGAMLKEYGHLLSGDKSYSVRAAAFSARVFDWTECMAERGMPDDVRNRATAPSASVSYHAACHLAHAQKVRKPPAIILERLREDIARAGTTSGAKAKQELDVLPLFEAEHCCGSAGIFNLLNPELSLTVLKRKVERIKESGARTIVTTNPGCLLQLSAGARFSGGGFKVQHLASYLKQAYSRKQAP